MYEMIIFDIDGTLWEACEITMRAANIDFIHARYGFGKNVKAVKFIYDIKELL